MNKKFLIDIIPYAIIIIVIGAYFFLNSYDNISFVQKGGNSPKGGYPKGTPFLYQMRYIVYFFIIFLIIFNIYYGIQTVSVSNISFYESGKAFLTSFHQRTLDIKEGRIKPYNKMSLKNDPLAKEYDDYTKAFKVEYGDYTTSFCNMFAACTCCGVGDNAVGNAKRSKECDKPNAVNIPT
jgi:hypothetical protein